MSTGSSSRLVTLEIPNRNDFVSFVRVVVSATAELRPDFSSERLEDLKLAVSEAVTNAISANELVDSEDRVRIECHLTEDQVSVLIHDSGHGFDPESLPDLPEPEDPDRLFHESGLGLPLITMLADESEISSDAGGTDVKLVVYTSARRKAAG